MNKRETIKLSKKILISNKNKIVIVIIGFSISLIFLLCFFYLSIGYNSGLNSTLNKDKSVLSTDIVYKDKEYDFEYSFSDEYMDDIINNKKVSEYQTYTVHQPSNYYEGTGRDIRVVYPKIKIGDQFYDTTNQYNNNQMNAGFIAYDMENTSNIISKDENDYLINKNSKGILAGTVFTKNKNEIIISNSLLDDLNLDYNSIIGKKFSYYQKMSYSNKIYVKNYLGEYEDKTSDYYGNEICYIKDCIIVGVFNNDIYSCPSRHLIPSKSLFWITDDSIYKTNKVSLIKNDYYFSESLEEIYSDSCNQNKLYIWNEISKINVHQTIHFNNFTNAKTMLSEIDSYGSECNPTLTGSDLSFYQVNETLSKYLSLSSTYHLLSTSFLITSITLAIISLIFIIRLLFFNFKSKLKFYAICNSIGMKKKQIKLICRFQVLIIMLISFVTSLIISFIISLIGTIVFNKRMTNVLNDIKLNYKDTDLIFKINFGYYFVSALIVIIILSIIYEIMSLVYHNKINKIDLIKELNN